MLIDVFESVSTKLTFSWFVVETYSVTADHDIGIIAPYHAQCRRISKALSGVADDIKVGSVEEFQGQVRLFSCFT